MSLPLSSFQGVSPVCLSSSCSVLEGNSAIPDSGQLSYPFRKAIIIEEIRFDLSLQGTANNFNLGALVSAKFNLGQLYLMRDPVPVWLLGTTMAATQEEAISQNLTVPIIYSHYRWRLPAPLYVEAGQVLSSWFTRGLDGFNAANGLPNPINVQVSYIGRTVPPNHQRPKILSVPYAAPWVTTLGNVYQQSNEFNLFNPFDKPLQVQRLTGRVLRQSVTPTLRANVVRDNTPSPTDPTGATMTVLMNDSWGGKMVNNLTGPSDVWDILRSAWTVDTIMPPKGVYEVRAWNINTDNVLHTAVIGMREEKV